MLNDSRGCVVGVILYRQIVDHKADTALVLRFEFNGIGCLGNGNIHTGRILKGNHWCLALLVIQGDYQRFRTAAVGSVDR